MLGHWADSQTDVEVQLAGEFLEIVERLAHGRAGLQPGGLGRGTAWVRSIWTRSFRTGSLAAARAGTKGASSATGGVISGLIVCRGCCAGCGGATTAGLSTARTVKLFRFGQNDAAFRAMRFGRSQDALTRPDARGLRCGRGRGRRPGRRETGPSQAGSGSGRRRKDSRRRAGEIRR